MNHCGSPQMFTKVLVSLLILQYLDMIQILVLGRGRRHSTRLVCIFWHLAFLGEGAPFSGPALRVIEGLRLDSVQVACFILVSFCCWSYCVLHK